MDKKLTLQQRIEQLEYMVFKPYIKDCPRCKAHALNRYQDGVCSICAYATPERFAGNYDKSREPIFPHPKKEEVGDKGEKRE